jgi:hypothetical protein
VCRPQHVDLLDAAHIRGDAETGQPVVTNGLAMSNRRIERHG